MNNKSDMNDKYLRTCSPTTWHSMLPWLADHTYKSAVPTQRTAQVWLQTHLPSMPSMPMLSVPKHLLPTMAHPPSGTVLQHRQIYYLAMMGLTCGITALLCELAWWPRELAEQKKKKTEAASHTETPAPGELQHRLLEVPDTGEDRKHDAEVPATNRMAFITRITGPLPRQRDINFFLYYVGLHVVLFVMIDVTLMRGWLNPTTMLDWEIWFVWILWVCATQLVSALVTYVLQHRPHQHPSFMLPALLMPVLGNELHVMLDHVKVALFLQASFCVPDDVEHWRYKLVLWLLAYVTLAWLYLHLPFLFMDERVRQGLRAGHWPIVEAASPGGEAVTGEHSFGCCGKPLRLSPAVDAMAAGTTPDKLRRAVLAELPLCTFTVTYTLFAGSSTATWIMIAVATLKVASIPVIQRTLMPQFIKRFGIGWNAFCKYSDGMGRHPVSEAALLGDAQLIEWSIKHAGLQKMLHRKDSMGNSPLHQISLLRCPAEWVVTPLREQVAMVNYRAGEMPLHTACRNDQSVCRAAFVSELLKAHADPEAKTKKAHGGWAPIRMLYARNAALSQKEDRDKDRRAVLSELLKARADVHAQTNDGSTAFHMVAAQNKLQLLQELIAEGSNVNAKKSDGSTALHLVAANRGASPELLQELIAAGSVVNAKKQDGSTALHIVANRKASPDCRC